MGCFEVHPTDALVINCYYIDAVQTYAGMLPGIAGVPPPCCRPGGALTRYTCRRVFNLLCQTAQGMAAIHHYCPPNGCYGSLLLANLFCSQDLSPLCQTLLFEEADGEPHSSAVVIDCTTRGISQCPKASVLAKCL